MNVEQRLMALERRLAQYERMRADPTTGFKVVWTNGMPTIVNDSLNTVPIAVTGYNSSGAASGSYCWQSVVYDTSGSRCISGALYGGSGAASGNNLLYEANGQLVTSFPLQTWAQRRMYTLNAADVWEFQAPGAGGGSSGPINLVGASGYSNGVTSDMRVSGIDTIYFRWVHTSGAGGTAAWVYPEIADGWAPGIIYPTAGANNPQLLYGPKKIADGQGGPGSEVSGKGTFIELGFDDFQTGAARIVVGGTWLSGGGTPSDGLLLGVGDQPTVNGGLVTWNLWPAITMIDTHLSGGIYPAGNSTSIFGGSGSIILELVTSGLPSQDIIGNIEINASGGQNVSWVIPQNGDFPNGSGSYFGVGLLKGADDTGTFGPGAVFAGGLMINPPFTSVALANGSGIASSGSLVPNTVVSGTIGSGGVGPWSLTADDFIGQSGISVSIDATTGKIVIGRDA